MVGTPPREPPRCERREAFRKGKSIGMGLFVIKGKRIEAGEEVCEITGRVIIGVKAWLAWKQKHLDRIWKPERSLRCRGTGNRFLVNGQSRL